ncbi:MAG: DegT/DnrJ/EryC1/StrS family aminotransferase, partial [Flavobacteriales bacterium]|nr:DegT/DnrJ/EryC1/StrS family aminotransferase [Flavobacteriales bacterium]
HVLAALASQGIHCRRYFYPSLDELPYVVGRTCPHSRDAALRTLCLPLYPDLTPQDTDRITRALLAALDEYR